MTAATHIALSSSSRIMTGGMLMAGALDAVADGVRTRRIEAANSLHELALRLQDARQDEALAIQTAAALQRELASARAEIARLRTNLAAERASKAELQEVLADLCSEIEAR